nr:cobalamin-binding protein [Wenzhouxiangella sp. XN24]
MACIAALGLASATAVGARAAGALAANTAANNDANASAPTDAAPAQRIVTLAPHLAELVYAAGAGARLAGTVEWSDYPPAAKRLPRVGDAFRVDLESLAVLDPDLLLAWRGGNPDHLLEQLEDRGYRVVALAPERLDDIALHLETIGRLAGTPEPAAAAAARYRDELAALRAAQAGKREVRVFYQVSWRPLYTVGGRQLISEVIALCGGRNVFEDLGALAPAVGIEAVIARDPEVILAGAAQRSELEQWRRWPTIEAVAEGQLHAVDGDLVVRASPRILGGIRQVCAALDTARAELPGIGSAPPRD